MLSTDESDHSSSEGQDLRNLFQSNSSSSSSNDSGLGRDGSLPSRADNAVTDEKKQQLLETKRYMHVLIQQKHAGGSISERLWPAAQSLATYIVENKQHLLCCLLGDSNCGRPFSILELGAGVGLTGLELATQLSARILLTDLPEALPILRSNIELNCDQFVLGCHAVQAQVLEWGNQDQAAQALEQLLPNKGKSFPLLVIGSDCVYWDCLHEPLELTLYHILSQAPSGSMCLLAGMRRWKSDTKFFKALGKKTATKTHRLVAECIDECVLRAEGTREITRIYKIKWMPQ